MMIVALLLTAQEVPRPVVAALPPVVTGKMEMRFVTKATPAASWITVNDYPPVAVQAGIHGAVKLRYMVEADGRADKCTVLTSSGSTLLDVTACTLIEARARYVPDLHAPPGEDSGIPQEQTIKWVLPEADRSEDMTADPAAVLAKIHPFALTLQADVGHDGVLHDCRLEGTGLPTRAMTICAHIEGQRLPGQTPGASTITGKHLVLRASLSMTPLAPHSTPAPHPN